MNKRRIKNLFVQFIKFGIVGVGNTAISLLVYYMFIWFNPRLYLLGNAIGWIVGVAISFFLNNKFVFKSHIEERSNKTFTALLKLGKSYLCYSSIFLLSSFLLYWEIEVIGWSATISPVLNFLVTVPANYMLNKFWVFKQSF